VFIWIMTATKPARAAERDEPAADELGGDPDGTIAARIEERIDRMRNRLDDIDIELRRVERRLAAVEDGLRLARWVGLAVGAAVLAQAALMLALG
jgi:hypothetical protein